MIVSPCSIRNSMPGSGWPSFRLLRTSTFRSLLLHSLALNQIVISSLSFSVKKTISVVFCCCYNDASLGVLRMMGDLCHFKGSPPPPLSLQLQSTDSLECLERLIDLNNGEGQIFTIDGPLCLKNVQSMFG